MKNLNIGTVKYLIMNKLENSLLNNTPKTITESNEIVRDFFEIIKESPILQLEFKVFTNLESKYIDNELAASRYIDNNINLFEIYTIEEIEAEHEKLKTFVNEDINLQQNDKTQLYESIYTLIEESLIDKTKIDVDKIHESYTNVLNHIKQPKETLLGKTEESFINEEVIEIAVEKYNQKYESMNESDKELLQKLIKFNDDEKNELLETYKTESITLLENSNNETVKDNISKAIQKIKEMKFNKTTVDDNIISLYELKKDIL